MQPKAVFMGHRGLVGHKWHFSHIPITLISFEPLFILILFFWPEIIKTAVFYSIFSCSALLKSTLFHLILFHLTFSINLFYLTLIQLIVIHWSSLILFSLKTFVLILFNVILFEPIFFRPHWFTCIIFLPVCAKQISHLFTSQADIKFIGILLPLQTFVPDT